MKGDVLEPFYANGLHFSCRRCSQCCRVDPGYVFLSETDATALSDKLGMKKHEFMQVYCRWVDLGGAKKQLSLKETSAYDCIFWKGACTVYDARPLACKTYPFWQSMLVSKDVWDAASSYCPGCGSGELFDRNVIEACIQSEKNNILIQK
ncbi:MAG: YkgJ family cysteine cluster protein [Spirochaetaceae bacterium]|nr:YkgJ family cysteine cluster protein [Spirochaetaceae bacterium]